MGEEPSLTVDVTLAGNKSPPLRATSASGCCHTGPKNELARTSPNANGVAPGLLDRSNQLRPESHHQSLTWWCRMLDLIELRELSNLSPSIDRRETRAKAVA
jgi:hypothetical protein